MNAEEKKLIEDLFARLRISTAAARRIRRQRASLLI